MKIGEVKGADSITNAWAMQQSFSKAINSNMEKVAELVQTLMTSDNNKNKNNPDFAAALSAVKNELQSTGSASSKSLNNVYEMLGDNNKAKSIISSALLKDVSNSNNNGDKSQNDRNQIGETVTSPDGSQIVRDPTVVQGNSNTEFNQDNGTGSNSQKDQSIIAITNALRETHKSNPLIKGLSFPEKSVVSRIEKLVGGLSKDIVDLVKKSSDQGDLSKLQKTWNNQTKVSNKKDND